MCPLGYWYNKGQNYSSLNKWKFILSHSVLWALKAWGCYGSSKCWVTRDPSVLLLCQPHLVHLFLWSEMIIQLPLWWLQSSKARGEKGEGRTWATFSMIPRRSIALWSNTIGENFVTQAQEGGWRCSPQLSSYVPSCIQHGAPKGEWASASLGKRRGPRRIYKTVRFEHVF